MIKLGRSLETEIGEVDGGDAGGIEDIVGSAIAVGNLVGSAETPSVGVGNSEPIGGPFGDGARVELVGKCVNEGAADPLGL